MTTGKYIIATAEYPTAREAFEESEGWANCAHHRHELVEGAYWIELPQSLADVWGYGECSECYEAWVNGIRIACEQDAEARWEEMLR